MNDTNKYKLINGNDCLKDIPNGAKIYNPDLSLLECDSGYIINENECIPHCYNTCETCFDYSEDPNQQKCLTCLEGYYLVGTPVENEMWAYLKTITSDALKELSCLVN